MSPLSLPPALLLDASGHRPGPSTRDVAPALATSLGLTGWESRIALDRADRIVLAVIDGMGAHQVGQRLAHARAFCRDRWANTHTLTTCVPSTTAAAITTLTCGEWPGHTNMLGYEVVHPTLGPFSALTFRTRSDRQPVPADGWNPVPTLFTRLRDAHLASAAIVPPTFVGSGLTGQALAGADLVTARRLEERIEAAVREARRYPLTYLYIESLDHVGHHDGWDSPGWLDTLEVVDGALADLRRRLPAGTLLAVTADHGMVNPDPAQRYDLAASPLAGWDLALGGEPRALHVHVRSGDPGEAAALLQADLGERGLVVARADLPRLVGPLAHAELAGDFWVFATDRATIVDSRVHSLQAIAMRGVHGSLTPAETEVPLLIEVV